MGDRHFSQVDPETSDFLPPPSALTDDPVEFLPSLSAPEKCKLWVSAQGNDFAVEGETLGERERDTADDNGDDPSGGCFFPDNLNRFLCYLCLGK